VAISYVGGASASTTGVNGFSCSLTSLTGGSNTSPSQDDLVVVVHAANSTSDLDPGVSTAGYTEATDLYFNATSRDIQLSVSYKFMGSTPDTTVALNAITGSNGKVATVMVFRGVDKTTPLDVAVVTSALAAANSQTNFPVPSITPTTAGSIVVGVVSGTDSLAPSTSTFTAPGTYSASVAQFGTAAGAFCAMGYRTWSSGATGAENFVKGGTGATQTTVDSVAYVALALRPAATNPTGQTNKTLAALTTSSAGSQRERGTVSKTLAALTSSSAASQLERGTLSKTLAALTSVSAATTITIRLATLSKTLAALTSSSAGKLLDKGQTLKTLAALTSSSAGQLLAKGNTSKTLAALTSSSAGKLLGKGQTLKTLAALTSSSAAKLLGKGQTLRTLAALTSSSTGSAPSQGSGSLSRTLAVLTSSSAAIALDRGIVSRTLAALTSNSAAKALDRGGLSRILAPLTSTSSGRSPDRGTFSGLLELLTSNSSGRAPIRGLHSGTLALLTSHIQASAISVDYVSALLAFFI
jgi:hypothetical protein